MKHGDFSDLAENYARYRPGYAPFVLDAFLALAATDGQAALHCADVGAGTGIWSRQLAAKGIRVTAVEPNDAMREAGKSSGARAALKTQGFPKALAMWSAWPPLFTGRTL